MDLKFPKAMYHTVHIYTPCSRLPLYQGPTATYVVPLLALMTLPQWNCPDDVSIANSTAQSSIVLEKIQKVWSFKLCLSDIFWNYSLFSDCAFINKPVTDESWSIPSTWNIIHVIANILIETQTHAVNFAGEKRPNVFDT